MGSQYSDKGQRRMNTKISTEYLDFYSWRRLLRVPWTARSSNQSILKEISPKYSLKGTDAEAETPILWPPYVKNWLGKDPDAGKDWRQEENGMAEDEMAGWHQWTQWTWAWASSASCWWTGKPGMLQSMGLQRVGHDGATELTVWYRFCFLYHKSWIWY